ncbi:MAG: AAA family ATPase, partial [Chitinispirillales bacterium]|nr:AAA family ATPase [Chitinispirillales bacterium]
MQELPTGLQEFEYIRKAGALYVDKTDMIYNIVSGAKKQYFISRPRRFGKTLLCWTLNALFSGKRELFEGLAIAKTDWEWESFPVIHLDMSKVTTSLGTDGVRNSLIRRMEYAAQENEIDLRAGETDPGEMLADLIVKASKKHGKPAVVIVDEYDKPFLDFYNKPPMAEEVRGIMRGCYSQLKANEPHMRFLFMTGISKFTKAGVFSTLNNLNDLSLDSKFGTLLGYTEKELVGYFAEHLEAGAEKLKISVDELVDRLRRHYDGFCFDGSQRVYCPFSVLNFFSDCRLLNYWMDSGGTRVIAEYMKGRNLTVEQFRGMSVSMNFVFSPGEIESTPPEGFLYQAGYLTLREGGDDYFLLDYPNTEVLDSMSELVTRNMVQTGGGEF